MYDLIIFDCDGVLVDSEDIANKILGKHLAGVGLNMTSARIMEEYVGLSMKSVVEKIERQRGAPLPDGWLDRLQRETFAAFERELKPVAGVREVLEQLEAKGVNFCVASSGSPEKIHFTLNLTGLYPFFRDRIFSAAQVARGKPAPDLFLRAAAVCGASPGRSVVIEDSRPGVEGAIAAGMTALGFAARGQADDLRKAGARIFSQMDELSGLLLGGRN